MLEYQILMVPVVQDMESRRTIGLFFLKDVFWLLRSGKYFDQPIHVLLKEIYQDAQKDESDLPECEGEEDSDFGEFLKDEGIDEDGQDFLYELDTESKKSGSKISDNRVRSYNGSKQNMAMDDTMPGTKTKMEFSSANDVYQMNNQSEASKNLRNILSQEESNILQRKESSGGYRLEPETSGKHFPSTDYMRMKNHSHNSKISGRIRARTRGWSINSFKKDFITKKLVAKTKEIYGINRVAIFNPDCTLKE
mmetsp:Transcript_36516/g.36110  ORF Transcript_36516/g.36110 Transcript_36516/m.36110 type:complete len:251 (-) Transcript_36516:130-882(-)